MSLQRTLRRRSERTNWALDVMDARGYPNASTPTLALAGNRGSGLRKRAAKEAFRRAKRYFELTGKVVVPTKQQILGVALQLVNATVGKGYRAGVQKTEADVLDTASQLKEILQKVGVPSVETADEGSRLLKE